MMLRSQTLEPWHAGTYARVTFAYARNTGQAKQVYNKGIPCVRAFPYLHDLFKP